MIEEVPAIVWHMLIDLIVLGGGGLAWRYISNTRKKIDDHLAEASGIKSDIRWIKQDCRDSKETINRIEGKMDKHMMQKNGH